MDESTQLRQCLGKFATGVTVVTCSDGNGKPFGITANSFSSVSLDPPLVLWNIATSSRSLNTYLEAEHFAINILADDQQHLSHHFAQTDLFDDVDVTINGHGVPLIPGSLANLECATFQVHEAGDHFIIIGRVEALSVSDRKPLLFYSGHYAVLRE